jgi:alpha-tubulin suppressor-like RCC1 family protein
MSNRTTNFKDSAGNDLGLKLVDRDYLYSVYPSVTGGGLRLFVWSSNTSGALAQNDNIDRSTPVQEWTSSANWKQVSGYESIAGIKSDGTLWCWGLNSYGQLGDNTNDGGVAGTNSRSTPRQERTSSTNWKQVSMGSYTTTAIKTNGTLWSWGSNDSGQIGDNTQNNFRSTPRQEITSSTNWKQVSTAFYHTAAIKTDGTLWCWGANSYGQIGDNTIAVRSTPRQEITSSTNWKQVSASTYHTAALKTDGTLWCWGRNSFGQLGDNTLASRSTPRQEITSSTNWKQVSAGGYNTTGIKTNGTLWVWGQNSYGQIGDNTTGVSAGDGTNSRSTPRQEITSSTNWKQVNSAGTLMMAIKTDGTLWGWGFNQTGEIGDNTNITRSTPRQEFTSSTNWVQCSIRSAIKAPNSI